MSNEKLIGNIILIDEKIHNYETEEILNELLFHLNFYKIIPVCSVEEAFKEITNNYQDYKFKLFYVIVSGTLSEEFCNEYIKQSLKLNILAATIVYCSEKDRKLYELKPYYLDSYLNPGKVTDSPYYIIDYIEKIECPYYLEESKIEAIKENNSKEIDLIIAAEFTYVKSIAEIAFSILITKHINSTLIESIELEKMQKVFIKTYPQYKHLFKPSQEKNIFIPYHILAKFYLYLYTIESNFFLDMNKELKEKKFDKYRIYIYLMYHALNKGIFKSNSLNTLYRGGTLSFEEFNSLKEKLEKKRNSNSLNDKVFFYSTKFLSFSKKEYIANEFLQSAILNEYIGVYVKFIIEGTGKNNFYVSNIDINEMKLSAYSNEEEVLFLPLSCFEVINIEDQNFYGYNIKIIRLKYLHEYKKLIDNKFEEFTKNPEEHKKELEEFIEKSINSKYAKELSKCLGNKLEYNYLKEFSKKNNIELKLQPGTRFQYKNSNPNKKIVFIYKGKLNDDIAKKIINHLRWLNKPISAFQFGSYNGEEGIGFYDKKDKLFYFDDCDCTKYSTPNQRLRKAFKIPNKSNFQANSEKCYVEGCNLANTTKIIYKCKSQCNSLNKKGIEHKSFKKCMELKEKKIKYKGSGAIEATMIGNAVGHFLANFSEFKNANLENKIKICAYSSIPIAYIIGNKLISIIPIIKHTSIGSKFRKGFLIFNILDIIRSVFSCIFSESLTEEEKCDKIAKKVVGYGIDILCGYIGSEIAMKIAFSLNFVSGPGAIIIGLISGIIFGHIGGKLNNKINEKKEFIFYSDSFYPQYIPKKYRTYAIPTLKWENVPSKSKSFAIEFIVNEDEENPSWLVINIPGDTREISQENLCGDVLIEYQGISENAVIAWFILYIFDKTKIEIDDYINMKNGNEEGIKFEKHLIDYKILIVA